MGSTEWFEIRKTLSFEAAHRLNGLPQGHKCGRLHGHSYKMTLVLQGPSDEKIKWVQDFSEIKRASGPLIDLLDHSYLNEIEGIGNPTSEAIAKFAYDFLKSKLEFLQQIIIAETCTTESRYPVPKAFKKNGNSE